MRVFSRRLPSKFCGSIGLIVIMGCVPSGREGTREFQVSSPIEEMDASVAASADAGVRLDAEFTSDAVVRHGENADSGTPPVLDASFREDANGQTDTGSQPLVDAGFVDNCPPGLSSHNGACAPDAPEPFRSRTESQICQRWTQDHVRSSREWEATPNSTDPCDPGTLPESAYDNAILRTNLYRWLAGLSSVTEAVNLREQEQACAVIQSAIGGLNHRPPETAACYTSTGAAGARSSNLARGLSNMAGTVDLYVGDRGVASLGHRRWVLNPSMEVTAFGLKNSSSCMYAFSRSGQNNVDFWSWPPPGNVPLQATIGEWSFSSDTYGPNDMTTIEYAIDEGSFQEASSRIVGGNYGWGRTIAWTVPAGSSESIVRIRINNTRGGDFSYAVRFVNCN